MGTQRLVVGLDIRGDGDPVIVVEQEAEPHRSDVVDQVGVVNEVFQRRHGRVLRGKIVPIGERALAARSFGHGKAIARGAPFHLRLKADLAADQHGVAAADLGMDFDVAVKNHRAAHAILGRVVGYADDDPVDAILQLAIGQLALKRIAAAVGLRPAVVGVDKGRAQAHGVEGLPFAPKAEQIGKVFRDDRDAHPRRDLIHRQANPRHQHSRGQAIGRIVELHPVEAGFAERHRRQRGVDQVADGHPQIVLALGVGGDEQVAKPRVVAAIRLEQARAPRAGRLPLPPVVHQPTLG